MSRHHDNEAPRGLGVISSVHAAARGFIFATMADQTDVFLHKQAFRPMALFDEIIVGELVSFAVADAPKGLRGHDVRRMTDSEKARYEDEIAAAQDRRGNTARYGQRTTRAEAARRRDR